MSFFGHVMRNKEIESFSISGKIEGKRCRGRQRIIYTKSLSEWMKVEETEMIRASKDREIWKTMTTQAWTRHGTWKKKNNKDLTSVSSSKDDVRDVIVYRIA